MSLCGHTLHPSDALLSAVNNLRSQHGTSETSIPAYLAQLRTRIADGERPEFQDPGPDRDFYFPDDYHHTEKDQLCEGLCEFEYATWRRVRGNAARRVTDTPYIHYGTIASSNALIVSSAKRNELYQKHKAICFEMESAGIVCNTQALVIRGICDYADAHKNKTWQKYAAATAVAYRTPKNRQPSSQSILECQKSLAFLNMDNRAHDFSAAAEGTCQWLINHVNYKKWSVAHRGLLWIKGKPGSGKSTLLKYAFKHLDRPQDIVLSFFFHGRGTDMQKTPLVSFEQYFTKFSSRRPTGEKWEWHLEELKSLFESSLQEMQRSRTVWLFVDALDEAGKENAKSIFQWLKSLVKISPSAGGQVRICVTCRHFPILDTACEFGICPEEENYEDITRYIRDRLSDYFNIFKSRIPSIITDRAAGVFMWARLVIDKVVDLELEGETMMAIEAAIDEIPLDLDLLYHDLIRDMKPASRILIEWTLLAYEPLELFDLRWAILVDAHHPYRSLRECYNSGAFIQDYDRMKRQICTLSRGLVETNGASNVQFIHQTVKDFFSNEASPS
ncbi:unnamed protein product [Parascedosporium putredinis]|uniref:NACHT domain-containing protein n=1 Tax=Parascedosporium putredinis TaxID=1442378 RepID=A0A9P1H0X5_9PEZI|nr:unnamed protein product [Parascedosporium putredinis]CAI7994373.1 unnamed protein product [Parascedosporium putredinis]